MSLISKILCAKTSKKLGHMLSMQVDTFSSYSHSPIHQFSSPPMFHPLQCPICDLTVTIPSVLANKPEMMYQNSDHDSVLLVCDKQWHVQKLTVFFCYSHNNVVSLVIFFSNINWSIPSYSGGKLNITCAHCLTASLIGKHARINKTCRSCWQTHSHFYSSYSPSPIPHFSFPPMSYPLPWPTLFHVLSDIIMPSLSQEITIPHKQTSQ